MKVLCITVFIVYVYGAHLPSDFKTCKKSDPQFNECLKVNIEDAIHKLANGNKALGLIPLDPLEIDSTEIHSSGGNVRIDQKLTNVRLHGLSTIKILNVKFDVEACKIHVQSFTPLVTEEGKYELKGQILIIPVNGKGNSTVTLTNLKVTHDISCEYFDKKGKQYMRVTDYKTVLEPEGVHFKYTNLFNGNTVLSDEVEKTLNDNSLLIFNDVKEGNEKTYGLVFKQLANTVLEKVPFNEIFLD